MASNTFKKNASFQFDNKKKFKIYKDQEEPKTGELFTDPLFPPDENSLLGKTKEGNFIDPEAGKRAYIVNPDDIEWKRSTEIFAEPQLYEGTITVDDIKQGKIGNCYFLSAIAAMCEFPRLISQTILSTDVSPDGIYQILMFIDGEFQIVYVDDYFPCIKGTNVLYFAKPNSFELWVILLEKAWAKVNGGYANIISGWPSDVFRAFTSFPCEKIIHKEEKSERSWGIIRAVDLNNGIICSSTKNDDSVENKGLIKNHTYTLIDTEDVVDEKGKKIHLCKLRNPWGYKVWNGEWCKDSPLWTNDIKKQIEDKYLDEEPGTFWMTIEDVNKYFLRTDLCQIIYGGHVKMIDINGEDLKQPQIYNIYVSKLGLLSISFIEKNWRYNRELRDKSHPTTLLFAEYDPGLKIIKHAFTDFECYTDVEKTRQVRPGFYILWVYKSIDASEEPKPVDAKIRFCCNVPYNIKPIGPDVNFSIISEIISLGVRHHHREKLKKDEFYYEIKNSFGRSGIAYRLIINPLATKYEEWENDASKVEGIMVLPPYEGQDKFKLSVGPNSYGIILGIQKDEYGDHWFNIESKIKQYECREGEDPVKFQRPKYDDYCTSDVNTIETTYDFQYSTFDILSTVDQYREVDHAKFWEIYLNKKYPKIMEFVIALEPIKTDKKLDWVEIKTGNGIYIGESDYLTRYGRGAYLFEHEKLIWIGYWDDNEKGHYGKLFDSELKPIYDGEYKNGKREGKGTYHYKTGEVYEGEWVDGIREGKGIFTWQDGTKWEGTFHDNEMDGEGVYFDGEDSYPATYSAGEFVE